jgi:hypothetical protein
MAKGTFTPITRTTLPRAIIGTVVLHQLDRCNASAGRSVDADANNVESNKPKIDRIRARTEFPN